MTQPYKKKLIEVAIPLEAINKASAREKSIRHGHPSTLHLWWARRPLAACRAVLFAQLVDDPSGYTDELLKNPKIRAHAEADLPARHETWKNRKADARGNIANTPEPTLEDCAAEIERKRLFKIIEELVVWENSTNEEVLERARAEIRKSCARRPDGSLPDGDLKDVELPPVYDPFSGGGSIPLEAQRLGLPAYGSDLNPVAVMIGKAMIEIPPKFKDQPPIHPGPKARNHYRNAEGLAEDVKYYGEWMRERAFERIGHLYPQVDLPKEYGGGKAIVVAWIWSRTVASPDPALKGLHVPIASSFVLSNKKGSEAVIKLSIDRDAWDYEFRILSQDVGGKDLQDAQFGTRAAKAQDFICAISGAPIPRDYIRAEGKAGRMGQRLMAAAVQIKGRRIFLAPKHCTQPFLQDCDRSIVNIAKDTYLSGATPTRAMITGGVCSAYGLTTWGDLYTDRQILALDTYSEIIYEVKGIISEDFKFGQHLFESQEYAQAVSTYLGLAVSKLSDTQNSLVSWKPSMNQVIHLFTRQSLPMVWDFAEANIFSGSAGDFNVTLNNMARSIAQLPTSARGFIKQVDAQKISAPLQAVFSTDPPYYDNIAYADISDFFYCWMRRIFRRDFPEMFSMLATPKNDELVASTFRHGSRASAELFFMTGMQLVLEKMSDQGSPDTPAAIYYAFKQSEIAMEGISSTGWAAFLEAIISAGYSVVGTWPLRTEMANRLVASGTNALANSVVLVCRKKEASAEIITRAEFIRAMKRELPAALAELQAANIAPADMPQSAIGPGMGVFSRYQAVLESDDSPMSVKTALQLINRELDEYLGGIQGEFDADTRFAITWFEQHGAKAGDYGDADNLARARGISVDSVKHAGIIESQAGKVRIRRRDELDEVWEPATDSHLTIWECLQHLVRQHEKDGIGYDTALLLRKIGDKAEAVKDLAYCLYDIAANKRKDAKEATAYNALIADWTELTREAAAIQHTRGDGQLRMAV